MVLDRLNYQGFMHLSWFDHLSFRTESREELTFSSAVYAAQQSCCDLAPLSMFGSNQSIKHSQIHISTSFGSKRVESY